MIKPQICKLKKYYLVDGFIKRDTFVPIMVRKFKYAILGGVKLQS